MKYCFHVLSILYILLILYPNINNMYNILKQKLEKREKPISVCVVGCGWFGNRVVNELFRIHNLIPKVIIDRSTLKAINTYLENGINNQDIIEIENSSEIYLIENSGKYIVSSNINLIKSLKGIDVVYEATGNLLAGAQAAVNSINSKINFVTVNYEMDATIGLILAKLARENGVIYSGSDGDQPGCLARMINEVIAYGLEPKIVGNCKQFLDFYQTPEGVKPWVPKGQDPYKICSFTDGSKQSLELASVGNAFGFHPLKRGLYGPKTKKLEMLRAFDNLVNLESIKGGYIDYTLGCCDPDQGGPIFVIAKTEDKKLIEDMKVFKKGHGPYYLFFRDHHLFYLEAISSIIESVLFNTSTLIPKGRYSDVIAIAKRDLDLGQKLDRIGGFDSYGLVERADITAKEKFLPLGLAEFAKLKKNIQKDTTITYDMVELEGNLVTQLRKQQDKLALP